MSDTDSNTTVIRLRVRPTLPVRKVTARFKGGAGSGDFGHEGRPGLVGGSGGGIPHKLFGTVPFDEATATEDELRYQRTGISARGVINDSGENSYWLNRRKMVEEFVKDSGITQEDVKHPLGAGPEEAVSAMRHVTAFQPMLSTYAGSQIIEAASRVFEIPLDEFEKTRIAELAQQAKTVSKKSIRDDYKANGASYDHRPLTDSGIDKLVKTTYDHTQKLLAEQGITELVVYRGGRAEDSNVIASYSLDKDVAQRFAGVGGVVQTKTIPASRIFAVPATGFGVGMQLEILVFDNTGIIKEHKVKARFKGGPGSGFAGHAGIPGHQGGSQSGNAPEPRIYDEEKAAVGPGWDKLNGVLQGWAIAEEASDSNMAILQGAAAHVFGGNADEAQYNRLMSRTDYRGNPMYDKAEFEQALKNLYEYTQSKLKEEYPSGEITLYRALHNIYDESVYPLAGKVALSNKVLSSWASTKEGTTQAIEYWGRDMGYRLLEAHVPIKNILAYPGSTFALMSHDEDEFIVISTGTPVQADIIDAEAYVRKEDKMKLKFVYKGGSGSGFHGHAGRPGKLGGSAPEGGVTAGGTETVWRGKAVKLPDGHTGHIISKKKGGYYVTDDTMPPTDPGRTKWFSTADLHKDNPELEEAARKRDAEGMNDAAQEELFAKQRLAEAAGIKGNLADTNLGYLARKAAVKKLGLKITKGGETYGYHGTISNYNANMSGLGFTVPKASFRDAKGYALYYHELGGQYFRARFNPDNQSAIVMTGGKRLLD